MAKLTVVYWRDIPAQIIAKQGRKTAKKVLPERFAEAIDKAAMRSKLAGTDAYLEQWQRRDEDSNGDLEQLVQERFQQIDSEYDEDRLKLLIRQGGLEQTES
jgi:hypothetical protein